MTSERKPEAFHWYDFIPMVGLVIYSTRVKKAKAESPEEKIGLSISDVLTYGAYHFVSLTGIFMGLEALIK